MGMDVYGIKPDNEPGKYFRNNVWWWRPLAEYVQRAAPVLTKECKRWDTNDGYGLSARAAKRLAAILETNIKAGETQSYADQRQADLDAMPLITCQWCGGTGIRTDTVGVDMGMTTKLCETIPDHPRSGQTGWCNGCEGRGTRKDWRCDYPFGVENVAAFAEFLAHCGGFKIC